MRSHFLHLLLYSTLVSAFFGALVRRSPGDRLGHWTEKRALPWDRALFYFEPPGGDKRSSRKRWRVSNSRRSTPRMAVVAPKPVPAQMRNMIRI